MKRTIDAGFGLQWCRPISNREEKIKIAQEVARRAKSGQTIGVGSGSTSFLTLLEIASRIHGEQLQVRVVPTSIEIEFACTSLKINYCLTAPAVIDWCFDGADEIDGSNRMIKGRGGALYRERLVFMAARRRLIVADKSKNVVRLGSNFPVPIEVSPYWASRAYGEIERIKNVSSVTLRLGISKDGPVLTEGGNVIFDAWFARIDKNDERKLAGIPGVICTGIFSGFSFERI